MEYGLIGEKLGHSFSKEIHKKLFGYDYILKEIPKENIDSFLRKKDFKAINVTIPYKQTVIPYLDNISDEAKKIGAVNTIVNKNGVLYGSNTDFFGLKSLIERTGISLLNKKVLIFGSGGTSKTALFTANSMGAGKVLRVSRTKNSDCITYGGALKFHADADVIINTTPCGMYPEIYACAAEIDSFPNLSGVIDAVYNPLRSKLVCDAMAKKIPASGGLYMLVAQAARAAELFTGEKVPEEKIEKIYRDIYLSKQNIVLVGMPGSGKSTVGKILSEKYGLYFVDCDTEIENSEKKTIPEIFKEHGEQYFRNAETLIIRKLACMQGAVISTGGGAVLNKQNIDVLKENGRIYFLDRPVEDIAVSPSRPLTQNREMLLKIYRERYSLYCSASDVKISCTTSENDEACAVWEEFCNENFNN